MNEQLDSQLSAMFDDELPAAECELLARRLSRDEALKARWERYSLIGASMRAERGVRPMLARRVTQALSAEAVLTALPQASAARPARSSWWQPAVGGVAIAGTVAACAILLMRAEAPLPAETSLPSVFVPVPAHGSSVSAQAPGGVVAPVSLPSRPLVSTQLANYLVAHAEVSSPVGTQAMLSALVGGDGGTGAVAPESEELTPGEDVQEDVKTVE